MHTSSTPTINRWFVVIGAILIQLALGAIYAWSVFTALLTDPSGPYAFTASETAWIFSAGLATFAFVMVLAGRLLPKVGPRPLAVAGGLCLGSGYILAGFFGSDFSTQLIFIGLLGGAGIGLGYVVPIAVGVKWFPDKKGLITGLAVAGFGFGATIWVKLAGSWFGGLLNTTSLFDLPGVQSVFLIYGVVFMALVLFGSVVMVDPPNDYQPPGWVPPQPSLTSAQGTHEFSAREMLQTPQFYLLWTVFMCSALAGLMVIYSINLFGIDALGHHGILNAGAITGTAMAAYAISNGIGRIVWGSVSDKIGRQSAIVLMTLLQGIVLLMTYHVFIMFGMEWGFIVAAALIGFNFGGNFALFPAATADYFGNRSVGTNYGWVFTAYGIAGISGPLLAGHFKDTAAGALMPSVWMTPFIIAGAACLVAGMIALSLRKPKYAPLPLGRTAFEKV